MDGHAIYHYWQRSQPNPKPRERIGNIAYDKWNNQLFITNFEDGKIYRFDMNGTLLSTFDPFSADATLGTFGGHGEALWGIAVHNENGVVKVFFSQWTEDNSLSDASSKQCCLVSRFRQ